MPASFSGENTNQEEEDERKKSTVQTWLGIYRVFSGINGSAVSDCSGGSGCAGAVAEYFMER